MIYERIGKGQDFVSTVSLGGEHLEKADDATVREVVAAALDMGINYIDIFMPQPGVREAIGKALRGKRDKVMLAGHLGSVLDESGQYTGTRDEKTALRHIDDFLRRTGSETIDMLMIHIVDRIDDFQSVFGPGGFLEVAERLKRQGKARMIGVSAHVASTARLAVESGLIDALMFPVNPLHDIYDAARVGQLFEAEGYPEEAQGIVPEKAELYRAALREGVSVVAMKPFAAGWLLGGHRDIPPMTPVQCIHYALSQPGVVTALCGAKNVEEVLAAARYCEALDEEKDLAVLSTSRLWAQPGCMYCNHCLPCPAGIDIAEVTRLLDAARAGEQADALESRAMRLAVRPSACVSCGSCDAACPFGVPASANVRAAAERWG